MSAVRSYICNFLHKVPIWTLVFTFADGRQMCAAKRRAEFYSVEIPWNQKLRGEFSDKIRRCNDLQAKSSFQRT